jgi:hypothetical protein
MLTERRHLELDILTCVQARLRTPLRCRCFLLSDRQLYPPPYNSSTQSRSRGAWRRAGGLPEAHLRSRRRAGQPSARLPILVNQHLVVESTPPELGAKVRAERAGQQPPELSRIAAHQFYHLLYVKLDLGHLAYQLRCAAHPQAHVPPAVSADRAGRALAAAKPLLARA